MLKFYTAPRTCALATHLALRAAGADFELVRLDFTAQQQRSAEYLRINPKSRVPALATDRGVLTETPALLQYIAQTWPEARLAPLDDAFRMAQMNDFNSYLCATVHVAHAHRMRGHRWADDPAAWEAMRAKVPQAMGDAMAVIEHELLRGPWALGEAMSVTDFYLLTIARWLEADSVDLGALPRVMAHREKMLAMPLVQQVLREAEA